MGDTVSAEPDYVEVSVWFQAQLQAHEAKQSLAVNNTLRSVHHRLNHKYLPYEFECTVL